MKEKELIKGIMKILDEYKYTLDKFNEAVEILDFIKRNLEKK